MERDAMISHGATGLLMERLMLVSDKYRTVFCRTCGNIAVCNYLRDQPCQCRVSGKDAEFGTWTFPFVLKLILQMLQAMSINTVLRFRPLVRAGGNPFERFLA